MTPGQNDSPVIITWGGNDSTPDEVTSHYTRAHARAILARKLLKLRKWLIIISKPQNRSKSDSQSCYIILKKC